MKRCDNTCTKREWCVANHHRMKCIIWLTEKTVHDREKKKADAVRNAGTRADHIRSKAIHRGHVKIDKARKNN